MYDLTLHYLLLLQQALCNCLAGMSCVCTAQVWLYLDMHSQPSDQVVYVISQIQGGNASSNDQKVWISTLQIQDAFSEGVIALQQYNERGQ